MFRGADVGPDLANPHAIPMQDSVRQGAQGPAGTLEIETAQLAVSSPDVTLTSRFGPLVRVVYREHRILLAMVAAYIAIGGSFLFLFGRPYPLRLTYPLFALMWVVGGGSYGLSSGAAILAISERPSSLPGWRVLCWLERCSCRFK